MDRVLRYEVTLCSPELGPKSEEVLGEVTVTEGPEPGLTWRLNLCAKLKWSLDRNEYFSFRKVGLA